MPSNIDMTVDLVDCKICSYQIKIYLRIANGAYYARHEYFKRLFLYNTFLKETH